LYTYVASVCFKCFSYFKHMLQVFYLDVAYVAMAIHVCWKCMFQMFQLFKRMLQMFYLYVALAIHVYCKVYVSNVSAISNVCCKYFI